MCGIGKNAQSESAHQHKKREKARSIGQLHPITEKAWSKGDDIHPCRNSGEASERVHDIDGQPGRDIRFRPVLDQDADNEFPAKHTWNWHNRSATVVRRLRFQRFLQDTGASEFPRSVRTSRETTFSVLQLGLGSRLSWRRGRDHRGGWTWKQGNRDRLRPSRTERIVQQRTRQRFALGASFDATVALLDEQFERRSVQLQKPGLSERQSCLRRRHWHRGEKQGYTLQWSGYTRFLFCDISFSHKTGIFINEVTGIGVRMLRI